MLSEIITAGNEFHPELKEVGVFFQNDDKVKLYSSGGNHMSKQSFGKNEDGKEVFLYTLENDAVRASFSDYGATMVSLIDKKTGRDVLLGFDSIEGYISHDAHIGGFIGRTANRIKNAEFKLGDRVWKLGKNSGENNLHGGKDGFDRLMYDAEETDNAVIFHRVSPDGEEGFPGDLDVTITYTLMEDGVEMKAEGKALDQDTLFAMTNHNYYNLDGSATVENHEVMIPAEEYALDSEDGISQLPLLKVSETPFDFRSPKLLGKDINNEDPQIVMNLGFDHHWAVDGDGIRTFAVCRAGGLQLTVESNLPGMHMYTANFLDTVGKNNTPYKRHAGVCFEPEFIPNGINYEGVIKPIVKAGDNSVQIIRMRLKNL